MKPKAKDVTTDARWMAYAARLGHRVLGTTAENPPVGCVIVRQDRVVGIGCTAKGGRPHAETSALAMVGSEAKGATAYVTLEPCSHHGRTAPCAEALVAAGIARVVTAFEDPDPRVSGRGHAILRSSGVEVVTGMGQQDCLADLAGFFIRITKNRPYVTLKLAVSSDGMLAAGAGRRTAISGEKVRARVHLMRAQSNAILVGRRTIETDDPDLTCRLPGMVDRSPTRIVLDSSLSLPRTARVVTTAGNVPTWVMTTRNNVQLEGVTVITCETGTGGVDVTDALRQLAERGVSRLLVEGGAAVARSFLAAGLVDEAYVFQSGHALGPSGVAAPLDLLAALNPVVREKLGEDTLTVYQRR